MKKLFAILTLVGAGFVAAPDASASPCGPGGSSTYVSHRTSCGCPVYAQRYVAYYDHCGRPVWQTRILPVQHRCRPAHHQTYRGSYRTPGVPPHARHGSHSVRIGPVTISRGSRTCR
jgi:hypothetical protein